MPQSTSNVRTIDDQLIVEAPTAEAALEVVADRLGTRAKIAGVERVRRGGVGGFFARELVQVAATGDESASGDESEGADGEEPENAVDRLLRQISERDDPFATTLQQQLAPRTAGDADGDDDGQPQGATEADRAPAADDGARSAPGDGAATPEGPEPQAQPQDSAPGARFAPPASIRAASALGRPTSGEPVTAPREPMQSSLVRRSPVPPVTATNGDDPGAGGRARMPEPGTPQWSVRNLCRLGLPPLLSPDEAARLAPDDDLGWTHAVAASLRPLCGPLPDGPTIIVGPAAERLAGALDLPVLWPGQPTPPESFVAPISGRHVDREWLASIRARRHLHLVVGGPGWRALLFDEPAVLSHTDASLCEVVSMAVQLGIGFGYTCHASGELTRTNPIDLAVAIRRLLPTYS